MQNFEVDLFMMVSRPSNSNLGDGGTKYDSSEVAKKNVRHFLLDGSDLESCRSKESTRRPGRPREGQGGPSKNHLDPKTVT